LCDFGEETIGSTEIALDPVDYLFNLSIEIKVLLCNPCVSILIIVLLEHIDIVLGSLIHQVDGITEHCSLNDKISNQIVKVVFGLGKCDIISEIC